MPRDDESSRLNRRRLLHGLGVGGAIAVAGCFEGSSDGDDGSSGSVAEHGYDDREVGGTFTMASLARANTMNPMDIGDQTTTERHLVMFDLGGRAGGEEPSAFRPMWLSGWELNDDYDVVEYELREGLEWGGDYGQLTAEDYLYALENVILLRGEDDWFGHPSTGNYYLGPDDEAIEYERTGDLSFRAELPVSRPEFVHEDPLPTEFVLPKALLEPYVESRDKAAMNRDEDLTNGVLSHGNLGPYRFVEWKRDSRWLFERNDDYYLREHADEFDTDEHPYRDFSDAPYFEEFEIQLFDEATTARSALEAGDVDMAGIGDRHVGSFRETEGVTLYENAYADGIFWVNLNHRINGWDPIRESADVRRAFAEAYNRPAVIENAYAGNAQATATYHPRWGPYYPDEADLYEAEGDLERARELLEEGTGPEYGYDGGEFLGPDGEQVELTAVRVIGNEGVDVATNYFQQRVRDLGLELTVDAQQADSLVNNYAMNSPDHVDGVDDPDWSSGSFNGGPWDQSASARDWDFMFGLGFGADPYAPWTPIESTMTERGTFNLWGYTTDFDIAGAIADASTAGSRDEISERMVELFAHLSRDVPLIWSQTPTDVLGYRDDVVGIPGEPTEDGFRARDYWDTPDDARLAAFRAE